MVIRSGLFVRTLPLLIPRASGIPIVIGAWLGLVQIAASLVPSALTIWPTIVPALFTSIALPPKKPAGSSATVKLPFAAQRNGFEVPASTPDAHAPTATRLSLRATGTPKSIQPTGVGKCPGLDGPTGFGQSVG